MFNLVNKIIAVDICNTIADIMPELNVRLGYNPNLSEYFHPGLSDKPHFFEENLDIFLEAKPIGNSAEILRGLAQNNTIVYITARPQVSELVTRIWLRKNGYPKAPIYFTNNKVEIASKLGVDIALEGAPHEIERYIDSGVKVLVKEQSYNTNHSDRFEWGLESEIMLISSEIR